MPAAVRVTVNSRARGFWPRHVDATLFLYNEVQYNIIVEGCCTDGLKVGQLVL